MAEISIPRPALGRPSDKRVTAEFLRSRNLNGPAFNPAQDVDFVDAVSDALKQVTALVSYADPALVTELRATAAAQQDAQNAAEEAYQSTAANFEIARQLLALQGITSVENVAATPAGVGLFRYRSGIEVGQVHERVSVGGPLVRRPDLEIGDAAQVLAAQATAGATKAALGNTALVQLAARQRSDGPQLVDGNRWLPQTIGTVAANGGTAVLGVDSVWVREFSGPVDIRWFGAKGDGIQDDAPAIQAASNSFGIRSGEVLFPAAPVAWTLGSNATGMTEASHPNEYLYSCLYPHDNRVYRGVGRGSLIRLKANLVRDPAFVDRIGPMGWARQSQLQNTRWENLRYEGGDNLLPAAGVTVQQDPRAAVIPSMAMVMVLNGGTNVRFDNVEVNEIAGSQCLFFPATAAGPNGVQVRNSKFWNNGSGKGGNFNSDHSSVYLNGENNVLENCEFGCDAGRFVQGAAWEIHGSNYRSEHLTVTRYQTTFWVAPNYGTLRDVVVNNIHAYEVTYAWGFGVGFALGHVRVSNSLFTMSPDANRIAQGAPYGYFAPAPQQTTDMWELDNVHLRGVYNTKNTTGLQLNRTWHTKITGGSVRGFSGDGLSHGGTELIANSGVLGETLDISGMLFKDNAGGNDIAVFTGGMTFLRLQNNTHSSAAAGRKPWSLSTYFGAGEVSGNVVGDNYAQPTMGGAAIQLHHTGAGAPTLAAQNGSVWVNRATGLVYRREADLWQTVTAQQPRMAGLGAETNGATVTPSQYPLGLSVHVVAGATGWPSGFGTVTTYIDQSAFGRASGFGWQQFVQFESGKMSIRSIPNNSNTFSAWLPLTHTPQAAPADLAAAPTAADFNGLLAKLKLTGVLF